MATMTMDVIIIHLETHSVLNPAAFSLYPGMVNSMFKSYRGRPRTAVFYLSS